ncbi:hypothetical protein [Paraliobacillus sediminis]|nr:hypothetical protein [Paraliobacillus sediminis]
MTNQKLSLFEDEIIAVYYYEGMLLQPTNPIHGMAVSAVMQVTST